MNITVLLFLLATVFLTGCARESLTGKQCENIDWTRIGSIDGRNGIESSYQKHVRSCGKVPNDADQALYSAGRLEGLNIFCTPENGYKMGLVGYLSGEICGKKEYPQFAEQFSLGRDVYKLQNEKRTILEQKNSFYEDQTVLTQVQKGFSALSGKSPTERLDKKQEELDGKIRFLESQSSINSPASSDMQLLSAMKSVSPINISQARKVAGAMVGTFLGFGVGHAIQGRYLDRGWMWTTGEVATLGYMISTWTPTDESQCQAPPPEQRVPGQNYCGGSVNGYALLAWLGFRVWQSYDLWSYNNSSIYNNSTVIGKPDGFLYVYRF